MTVLNVLTAATLNDIKNNKIKIKNIISITVFCITKSTIFCYNIISIPKEQSVQTTLMHTFKPFVVSKINQAYFRNISQNFFMSSTKTFVVLTGALL